jgi:hypothetical protein
MTFTTLIPAGLVLIALIGGWFTGLVMGWMAQQGQDRVLRYVAVRKAIRQALAALGSNPDQPAPEPPAPNLAPWYVERDPKSTTASTPIAVRPGMPFYRDPAKR